MTKDGREIEVQVVEVENTVPTPETEPVGGEWRQWQGQVRNLDSRWWPLWAIPGFIALMLLATVGVVIGLVAVIYVLCRKLIRAFFR